MPTQKVIIIGCGVAGISCGIRLLEAGCDVSIIAKEIPPHTTSDAAGAIWYPFKVYPEDKALEWGKNSLKTYYQLMGNPETGVYPVTFTEYFEQPAPDPWWKPAVRNFRRADTETLPPRYRDGYVFEVPFIDMPIYMPWLKNHFKSLGGTIRQKEIDNLYHLDGKADWVINCSGLGARQLCDDNEVYPVRGQSVKIDAKNDGGHYLDQTGSLALCYVLPRRGDILLGGTAEEHDYNSGEDPDTRSTILDKARKLDPTLWINQVTGYTVGLRPARYEVRLEKETLSARTTIIHNYGHGGAGFTLSWGCADEVASLIR